MTATSEQPVDLAERDLTVSEALAAGWYVAEFVCGDEVVRAYGASKYEARDRLEYDLAQLITDREPAS